MRLFDTELTELLKNDAVKAGLAGLGLFAYYLFTTSEAPKCNRNITQSTVQQVIQQPADLFQSSVYNLYLSSRGISSNYDKARVAEMIYKKIADGKDITDEDKMYGMYLLTRIANEVSSNYDKSRIAGFIDKIS